MAEFVHGSGRFVSTIPEAELASYDIGNNIELNGEARGVFFKNPAISFFRVISSLESNNMITGANVAIGDSSGVLSNSIGNDRLWGLTPLADVTTTRRRAGIR